MEKRGTKFRVALRMPDGTVTTDSTHERRAYATIRAKEIDVEVSRDAFIDPRGGRIPLSDWVPIWESTHQASPATWAAYRSHLRLHILPALGRLPLVDIRRQHVKALAVTLGKRLAPRSVTDVIMVLQAHTCSGAAMLGAAAPRSTRSWSVEVYPARRACHDQLAVYWRRSTGGESYACSKAAR